MNATLTEMFDEVQEYTETAKLIAFDGCHKIYLAMSDSDVDWLVNHGGYTLVQDTPSSLFNQLKKWYDKSCGLRFIHAVNNHEFTTLVEQGATDEEECSECGEELGYCECES